MLNAVLKRFSLEVKALILIVIGAISWSLTIVKSGLYYQNLGTNGPGLGFWGANGHDGVWHLALAESLGRGVMEMPVFAGWKLQNYHIGFDLFLALLNEVTRIPIGTLYFQILPPITAILIGILSYKFVLNWTRSKDSAFWAVFFVYFGGSFGWLLNKGESAFWSQQAISTLINPPYSLSLILILLGLLAVQKKKFFLSAILFGVLIAVKVYAGVLVLGALMVTALYDRIYNKDLQLGKVFLYTLCISLVIFFTLERGSQNLLVITPFWYLETLMGLADRLNWERFYSAMTNYKLSHNYIKLIPAYGVALIIFLTGNLGTRIILFSQKIILTKESVFVYSVMLGGLTLPMIFLQKGTPWNTIQFFYYSLFFASIMAGIAASKIKNKLLLFLLVAATIPTTYFTLKTVYIPMRPPAMLPAEELEALTFLAKKPDGIVLTKPYDAAAAKSAESNPPRPLYLYTSTAYVSAYSKHPTYLEDQINVDITGYSWQERHAEVLSWYEQKNNDVKREYLKDRNIRYVYWIKEGQSPLDLESLNIKNIFENSRVTIYEVK